MTDEVAPEEKKQRPRNEAYDLAELYAERLYPTPPEGVEDRHKRQRDGAIRQALKHFSDLCGQGARRKGYTVYSYKEVYLAWETLYEKYLDEQDTGAWRNPPTLLGVAYGANPWIETWRAEIMQNIPPVWETYLHDIYVKKYANVLKLFGFKYGAVGQPNRLTAEDIEVLGL
jgi:hypothetical protein